MKEFGSFTLMVALAEPPLGALRMAFNPSTMQFISLVVSWFCVVALLVGPQTHRKHPYEPKTLWMISPPLELPPAFKKISPQLYTLRLVCPLFPSLAHPKGQSNSSHPHSPQKSGS
jgi:hypothetical protein